MRGIFLSILIFSLFIPNKSQSADIDCTTITNETTCWDTPGCQKNSTTGNCEACGDTYFCPGGENNKKSCTDTDNGAGPDFLFAHQYMVVPEGETDPVAIRGARTKYECYKELDGNESATGHGAKCIDREGGSVSCRQYYRDSNNANNSYVSQWNGSTYYYIVCEDQDHASPHLTETVGHHGEDTKCIDLHNADLTLYQYYCAEAYSAPLNPTSTPTVMRYHIETNGKCYSNALTCGKFGATGGCTSANTNNISFSGYLRWKWNDKQWQQDTNATAFMCKCTKNNIDIAVSGNDYTCTGDADYKASGTMSGLNTVDGTSVAYNDYPVGYSCKSCKRGYFGFYKLNNNQSDNRKTCKKAAQGCYSYGCPYNISDNEQVNCTNDVFQQSSPSCLNVSDHVKKFYKPCYAGMTTFKFNNPDDPNSGLNLTQTTDGAFSPIQCHYNTDDTQFCDAYGCVSMDQLLDATGTSQDNWTWYMQQ